MSAQPGNPGTELRALLADIRRRWRANVLLRTTARGAGAAAVPVLAAVVLDWRADFQGIALLWVTAAALAPAAALAAIPFVRMQRRPDDRHVARFVEERTGGTLGDSLPSAVDLVEQPGVASRSGFSTLIVSRAVENLRAIPPAQVIDPALLRRSLAQAVAAGALLLLAIAAAAPLLSRSMEAARLQLFPASIQVQVVPGNARVPAGTALRIKALVKDGDAPLTGLVPSLTVSAGDERRSLPMQPAGDGFEVAIESVDRTFTYVVNAGAARSAEYTVTALFAPRVRRIDLEYVYPRFTGLQPRREEDGGDIYGPAGTRVRLRVHTDKPVAAGEVAPGATAVSALHPAGDRLLEGEIVLARDDSYRIRLADGDGLRSAGDTEYFIRLMDDRPPEVRILRPAADQQITPLEEVAIEARADDDYGVAHFDLVYAVAGGRERVVPFDRLTGTDVEKVGARLLAAEDLRVKPGDVITYYARVRDVARGKRSTETRSDIFFLEVKPFSEEFTAANSQASSAGGGSDIDNLVAAQKEIISATWNIERRAAAGRSAEDVAAIAKAQAELKARVERMAGGGGRPGGGPRAPAPQRPTPPQDQRGGSDPMAAAAEAMARALQQLEGQKTREAIAHEMAALNGLLQAQAEVRRRQVSQGASGSGGGGNRSGQDLSALFDKELQRQQRTNYENRSSVADRADRKEEKSSDLDRVKDLARRQEDLSRRQRELAGANLSAEERKRQLEKLTREQMELREQAEQLARQMQTQPGASGSMQQAAEQMRSAASDMRRDNAQGAAESGQRATEQLRRLEEQVRGATGGGSGQASGDLQVQAQQAAQEQKRIASEASRLDQDAGAGAAEAKRRLADEKERLAGRVEDLQRAARQAAKSGKGSEAAAAGDVATSLEQQRIAERMRESAREMRGGGRGGTEQQASAAAREQEMARALENAAETLGGGSKAGRALSEQLEQTRGMRDRLNRLEKQMRDAERRGDGRGVKSDELKKLEEQYQRELGRAREALAQLGKGEQRSGTGMSTPEQQEFSRSAPGTEAFKQDRSGWESLRQDIDRSLERYEASLSDRLKRDSNAGQLNAGGSERVPERYRGWIARYYQSLAGGKK